MQIFFSAHLLIPCERTDLAPGFFDVVVNPNRLASDDEDEDLNPPTRICKKNSVTSQKNFARSPKKLINFPQNFFKNSQNNFAQNVPLDI